MLFSEALFSGPRGRRGWVWVSQGIFPLPLGPGPWHPGGHMAMDGPRPAPACRLGNRQVGGGDHRGLKVPIYSHWV